MHVFSQKYVHCHRSSARTSGGSASTLTTEQLSSRSRLILRGGNGRKSAPQADVIVSAKPVMRRANDASETRGADGAGHQSCLDDLDVFKREARGMHRHVRRHLHRIVRVCAAGASRLASTADASRPTSCLISTFASARPPVPCRCVQQRVTLPDEREVARAHGDLVRCRKFGMNEMQTWWYTPRPVCSTSIRRTPHQWRGARRIADRRRSPVPAIRPLTPASAGARSRPTRPDPLPSARTSTAPAQRPAYPGCPARMLLRCWSGSRCRR